MRSEKISILNEIIERVKEAEYCFILNYGGLKVTQLTDLRKQLVPHNARALVLKNTYLGRLASEAGWGDVSAMMSGPTALISGSGDVAEVAKLLMAFVKANNKAEIKGATLEAAVLSETDVQELSKLPSKDAMRGMLLGTLQAPASSFVRVLNAPLLDMLYVLKAYADEKGA